MIRVYVEGPSVFVIGTDQATEAARHLPKDVDHWAASFPGYYVRRQRGWRRVVATVAKPPKDARPGVGFVNVVRTVQP